MVSIFDKLNNVNLSLQGKESDIFVSSGKIISLKNKIIAWKNKVVERNFTNFLLLNSLISELNISLQSPMLKDVKRHATNHLALLQENLEAYFPTEMEAKLQ